MNTNRDHLGPHKNITQKGNSSCSSLSGNCENPVYIMKEVMELWEREEITTVKTDPVRQKLSSD